MSVPQLSTDVVKAFAKTLRSRLNSHHDLEHLPSDLVAQLACDGPLGFPTSNSFIENNALVTCILAIPGCGKTTMAVIAAAIGKYKPRQRVIYLSPHPRSEFEPASSPINPSPAHVLTTLGFETIPSNQLGRYLKGYDSLSVYDSKPSDLDAILASQPSNTLVVTDELFLRTHDYDIPKRTSAVNHYIDLSMRIARKLPDVQLIFCEQSSLQPSDDLILQSEYVAIMRLEHWGDMTHNYGPSSRTFKMPKVSPEIPLADTVRELTKVRLVDRAKIESRIAKFIGARGEIPSHTAALEIAAEMLGFSSWHALQGHEKNVRKLESRSRSDNEAN